MLNQGNFVVRISGRRPGSYYIDYSGMYRISEIAKLTRLNERYVTDKYISNGAVRDNENDVYYFGSPEAAKDTIDSIIVNMKDDLKGISVILTPAEIEYIRKALINEGSQVINVRNSIKDSIFKKLNG